MLDIAPTVRRYQLLMNDDFAWIGPPVEPSQIEIIEDALVCAVDGRFNSSFLKMRETIFARMNNRIFRIDFMFM